MLGFREGTIYYIPRLTVNIVTFLYFKMIVPSFRWVFCSFVWFWGQKIPAGVLQAKQDHRSLADVETPWAMELESGPHFEPDINLETDH